MDQYSVLMSVYRNEKPLFFRQAIDSMLNQTVPPGEIVLVCDGALPPELDGVILDVCTENPSLFQVVRLLENRGLGVALSIGLQKCKYDLVARMDADDIALPDRMEKQLRVMCEDPRLCALGGQIAEFRDTPDNIIDYRTVPVAPDKIYQWAKRRNPMNHMTVLLRKSRVLEAGSYQHLPGFEDYHLWIRMLSAGQELGNIGDICCHVRVDDRMYHRRGGWQYFRNTLKVENLLRERKMINGVEYCGNVILRFAGTVLIPEKLRGFLFNRLLRKRSLR